MDEPDVHLLRIGGHAFQIKAENMPFPSSILMLSRKALCAPSERVFLVGHAFLGA
jgi:hypothetical protein